MVGQPGGVLVCLSTCVDLWGVDGGGGRMAGGLGAVSGVLGACVLFSVGCFLLAVVCVWLVGEGGRG